MHFVLLSHPSDTEIQLVGGCLLGQDRFLLQVAHKTVRQTWGHNVGED